MAPVNLDHVREALGEVIRDSLIQGNEVSLPGLGTFHVDRRPSEVEEDANGQIVMRPPRDEVLFVPDPR